MQRYKLETDRYIGIGRLTVWISADIQISTDILVCLPTSQFVPNSS